MTKPIEGLPVLSSLLPHSGSMCLLDRVVAWDEQRIELFAHSHCDPANPLRHRGLLPIHAGIEYAAQGMAIHGSLCEQRESRPRSGFLAALSNVDWYCMRLDDLPGELRVLANKRAATQSGSSYHFSLYHDQQLLLEGQAVVALQNIQC